MKKNQFALIFLTLIVMLAVWYIKSPLTKKDASTPSDPDDTYVSTRLDVLKSRREAITLERSTMVASLDSIIAGADTTVLQKEEALNKKQSLSDLTEKEVLLETFIMNLGYNDAFVYSSSEGLEIIVVADEENLDVALEIIQNANTSFVGEENIVVSFKSVTELTRN